MTWHRTSIAPALAHRAWTVSRDDVAGQLTDGEFRSACGLPRSPEPIEELVVLSVLRGWEDLAARARVLAADRTGELGNLAEAAAELRELREWARDTGEPSVLSDAHRALSRVFRNIGDLSEALSEAVQALAVLPPDAAWWRRGRALCVLGLGLMINGSWPEAKARLEEGLTVASHSPSLTLLLLNNLAFGSLTNGDLDAALLWSARMEALAAGSGVVLTACQRETLARVDMERGDLVSAREHLGELHLGAHVRTEADDLAMQLLALAEIHRRTGDFAAARGCLDRCEETARERGLVLKTAEVHRERAALHAAQGDFRGAFEEHRRYHAAWERLQDEGREVRAQVVHVLYANQEAMQARDLFRELATRDPLTGLYNRRHADAALTRLTAQAAPGTLSVALLDLDHFKRVNDTCSHEAGDLVLTTIGSILLANCPDSALIARLGGEEFLLAFPDSDPAWAQQECERLRRTIAGYDFSATTGDVPVTVSIGLTTAHAATTPSKLLADADRNLYAAKRMGRNRVVADAEES